LTLFTEQDQLDEIIKQVEMEVATFEHDMSNQARRGKTASLARKVASTKTYLDGLGKDLVADWKTKAKAVDANRKMMRDRLDELRDLARKPLTEWEEEDKRIKEEEAERIAAEKLREEVERDHEMALLMNAEFDRQAEEARKAEAEAERLRLEAEEKARLEREAQIAKEAKEAAEREAKEREERIKREAQEAAEKAERERLEAIEREEQLKRDAIAAEERRKFEAEQAEKQRIEAEARAKREAEEAAERAKQAEIQRQKDEEARIAAEQAKREANKRHIGAIRRAAKESLMILGMDEDQARAVVMAIHNGKIANVSIHY
jgi:hypothetical protein